MSSTDAPRPALGELARLATEAINDLIAWYSAADFVAEGFPPRDAEFIAACSPAVILQLVALASGGADAERGWAMALMELGKVPDPRLGGLHQVDVRQLTRRDRDFSSDTLRPLTDDEAHAAIAKFRAARSLTPERPADAT